MKMMLNDVTFDNKISNLPSGSVLIDDEFLNELKEYNKKSKMNSLNTKKYRDRINRLSESIGFIKPIDSEINNVVYFSGYNEVGIVINKRDISLKQVWTEYRLIYNEKIEMRNEIMENSFVLDNFDEIYDRISKKVSGLDKYVNDLNSLKSEINNDNDKLNSSKEIFEIEKIKFENYKNEEIIKLKNKEKELNIKLDKINNLISLFEEKLNGINNEKY